MNITRTIHAQLPGAPRAIMLLQVQFAHVVFLGMDCKVVLAISVKSYFTVKEAQTVVKVASVLRCRFIV